MNSTLRDCLRGNKIIEFPTFVVGSKVHTSKLSLMIQEITSLANLSANEGQQPLKPPLASPSGSGADDVLSPNKRRQLEELSSSAKKIRLEGSGGHDSAVLGGAEQEQEGDEEGEDEADEAFLKQLVDLESADISTLQNLIHKMEDSP